MNVDCCCFELYYYHRSNQFWSIENSLTTLKVFKPKKKKTINISVIHSNESLHMYLTILTWKLTLSLVIYYDNQTFP